MPNKTNCTEDMTENMNIEYRCVKTAINI